MILQMTISTHSVEAEYPMIRKHVVMIIVYPKILWIKTILWYNPYIGDLDKTDFNFWNSGNSIFTSCYCFCFSGNV